jgi:RNA-binding protein Musashi
MDNTYGKKLFLGGLAPHSTQESIRAYFSNYGVVQECILMVDRLTNRSRCFGFITMRDKEDIDRILASEQIVDGKRVDCKLAVPREAGLVPPAAAEMPYSAHEVPQPVLRTKKMFVGGLSSEVTDQDFREYFQQFGELEDSVVMFDRDTQRPRGFGFITFVNEESVDRVLMNFNHNAIKGKWVECKRATPKEMSMPRLTMPPNMPGYPAAGFPFYPGYDPMAMAGAMPPQAYAPMEAQVMQVREEVEESEEIRPYVNSAEEEELRMTLIEELLGDKRQETFPKVDFTRGRLLL